ncbi:MAG: hypothetical protein ABEJ57_07610 [Halobacteriaceae archaeon]
MSAGARLRVGVTATVREFLREPVNLVLIVALPLLIIPAYGSMMSAFPRLPYMETAPSTLGALAGTLYVAAFLPGVIGLFQVISARNADDRLTLTGFPRATLFGVRLVAVGLASVVTAAIGVTVLTTQTTVAAVPAGVTVLVAVGLLYGLIGMLIGAVLPRELEGSLVLIFLADLDEALASGLMLPDATITKAFPLYYPHRLFEAAVQGRPIETGDVIAVLAYLIGLLVVTVAVYTRFTGGTSR